MTNRKNMSMSFWLVLLSLATVLSHSGAVGQAAEIELRPPPGLVTPSLSPAMPAFRLATANDTTVQGHDLLGKVVVVRFWATWWPTCTGEMPSVQRAHDTLKDTDAVVLAISVDGGGKNAVQPFIAKHGYTVPTLIDTGMEVARQFGARGVPSTYIVNRLGKIVAAGFGPIDFDHPEFRAYIQALLAQPGG